MHKNTHSTEAVTPDSTPLEQTVQQASLTEIPEAAPSGPTLLGNNLEIIHGVKIKLTARIGDSEISVGELFSMKNGSVVKIDRLTSDPLDLLLDGKVVARGMLVVVDDCFGISITEIPGGA